MLLRMFLMNIHRFIFLVPKVVVSGMKAVGCIVLYFFCRAWQLTLTCSLHGLILRFTEWHSVDSCFPYLIYFASILYLGPCILK